MTLKDSDNSLAIANHLRNIFRGEIVGPIKHNSGTPQV